MRQAAERVGLVHELRELRGAKELLYGAAHGLDVDDGLRRYGILVLVVIRSRTTRSMRYIPMRNASCTSSPTVLRRLLPKCSYSSSLWRMRS